jgi:hypothetical protein
MPVSQPIDREKFLNEQARRFPLSHHRRENLTELLIAVEQEATPYLEAGERDAEAIKDRILPRLKERRGEFGGILTTLIISVIAQLIVAYIKKLLENWVD